MPAALPALGGILAGFGAVSLGFTTTIAGTALVGAIAGGVIGGIQSAIEGGDILEGVLYGSVGGAVGGAIGGAIGAYSFGIQTEGMAAASIPAEGGKTGLTSYLDVGGSSLFGGKETVITEGGKEVVKEGGVTMGEMMLAQGGIGAVSQALAPEQETPFGQTEAGVKAELESREKIASMQASTAGAGASAQLEAARVAAEQRMAEAELQATLTREKMDQDASEFQKSIAQRNIELERPIQEYYANLRRQRETATGLTLARKLREQAAPPTPAATTTTEVV